jgi:Transglutaminase-like superfamily
MNSIFPRLGKFLAIPRPEKFLLFLAVFIRIILSLGLYFLSFETLQGMLFRVTETTKHLKARPGLSVNRIAWIAEVSDRFFPGPEGCLVRAMTAMVLLGLEGHPSLLQIGIAKDGAGRLEGHAWVKCEGNTLFAGSDSRRFILIRGLGE